MEKLTVAPMTVGRMIQQLQDLMSIGALNSDSALLVPTYDSKGRIDGVRRVTEVCSSSMDHTKTAIVSTEGSK